MVGISVARIVRPQGRRGEVAATILTDFPERLLELPSAFLSDGSAEPRPVAIRACRLEPSRQMAVFHFDVSNSIGEAERLVGLEVQIPLADRMPLPADSYYVSDLAGCEIYELGANRALGTISDVQFTGEQVAGTPLLVVDTPAGELLVPFAREICREIDISRRRIVVELPDGLSDLNRRVR